MKLHGIFPPHYDSLRSHGRNLPRSSSSITSSNGIRRTSLVMSSAGSTFGESVFLTPEEKTLCWELVAKHAASGKTLIAGTGVESVRETVQLTNRAAEIGYKAAMVRTPHYYKAAMNRHEAQLLYFRAVADSAKIPLMIYNWPQTTGVDIAPEVVAKLAEHPNIIAIKESSGNRREDDADDPGMSGGVPGFGRIGADNLAVPASRRRRSRSRLRQRRPLRDHHHLGGAPHSRSRGRIWD